MLKIWKSGRIYRYIYHRPSSVQELLSELIMKMHIGLYYKDGGIECRIYCKNYKYTFHISETDQNIRRKNLRETSMLNRGLARLIYNPKVKVPRSPELNLFSFRYIFIVDCLSVFFTISYFSTAILPSLSYEWNTYPRASFCDFSEKSFASRSRSFAYFASTLNLRIKFTCKKKLLPT